MSLLAVILWFVIGAVALAMASQVWLIWSVAGPPKFGMRAMLIAVTLLVLAIGVASAFLHVRE
jgi:hypothetical protein